MSKHVCVLGGGVISAATACYLARDGHRVTVIESNERTGMEPSFANGGQLDYSYVAPLATPGVLGNLPGWMLSREVPLSFAPSLTVHQWRWCVLSLKACTATGSRQSTIDMLGLGAYSRELVDELLRDEELDFDFHHSGKLVGYRDVREFEAAKRNIDVLAPFGVVQNALDGSGRIALEPALAPLGRRLVGGIFMPSADTGRPLSLYQRAGAHRERQLRNTFHVRHEGAVVAKEGHSRGRGIDESGRCRSG
ncbi:FAD-dependent oxidoreductase [Caballeronia sp. DA-9]|uniref:FAD-dependent oxidoreductase n=1 Tax=Caballeronia sp. DA-9 TaxID=3436237 RepID=UPI003F678A6B